jgi:hypothetical protein
MTRAEAIVVQAKPMTDSEPQQMNLTQHPLSAAFPDATDDQIEGMKQGVIPMTQKQIEAVTATAWFRGLTKSQRAAYVVRWFDWPAPGSNQHKVRLSPTSPRAAAVAAQAAIQKAKA